MDVRLLLPATNDVPIVATISRSGYRELLEAGVRIFEYAGLMMHAKTSVADGWSSRVGSTNLNVTGLLTDWELDVVVEGASFGAEMEAVFERDLADSREMLLGGTRRRPRAQAQRPMPRPRHARPQARRVAAHPAARHGRPGVRRRLLRYEGGARALRAVGRRRLSAGLLAGAVVATRFPRLVAWPLAGAAGLVGASGLSRVVARPEKRRRGADEPI